MATSRFRCHTCMHIVAERPCPVCGNPAPVPICPRDHCHYGHAVVDGTAYCLDSGAAVCPLCGGHVVAQVSRITGYPGDVAGWNAAKRQEIGDRHRVEGEL